MGEGRGKGKWKGRMGRPGRGRKEKRGMEVWEGRGRRDIPFRMKILATAVLPRPSSWI